LPGIALAPDEVHVWRVALNPPPAACAALAQGLDAAEHARAERFYLEDGRRRFIVAHGVLRLLLAAYCGCDPRALRFAEGRWGKPRLYEPAADLCFNLSHSGELSLCAVTRNAEIGVDVEHRRAKLASDAIAARHFAPEELSVLRNLPPHLRTAAFFRCWTRKEAFIKARGEGLALPLDSFAVSLAPDAPAALLSIGGSAAAAAEWSLDEIAVPTGYTAAVAVKACGRRLVIRDWSHAYPG
jgi:4'-phosphopantetheinyl transferase